MNRAERDARARRLWAPACRTTADKPVERALRRFRPQAGTKLTLSAIRGPWRPSGTVAGASVFAVVWSTRACDFWAALSDFTPSAQLGLIEECARLDRIAGVEGNSDWRYE